DAGRLNGTRLGSALMAGPRAWETANPDGFVDRDWMRPLLDYSARLVGYHGRGHQGSASCRDLFDRRDVVPVPQATQQRHPAASREISPVLALRSVREHPYHSLGCTNLLANVQEAVRRLGCVGKLERQVTHDLPWRRSVARCLFSPDVACRISFAAAA